MTEKIINLLKLLIINKTLIKENRYYISSCSNITFYGPSKHYSTWDNVSGTSIKKGNFLELLNLRAKRLTKNKIDEFPKNAKYTHQKTKNEILSIMSHKSKYFLVFTDETIVKLINLVPHFPTLSKT